MQVAQSTKEIQKRQRLPLYEVADVKCELILMSLSKGKTLQNNKK